MLLSNIALELLPISGFISHLRKERCLVSACIVAWIERIVAELTRVYPSLLRVGQAVKHVVIIA
jgi:hypothetical protein